MNNSRMSLGGGDVGSGGGFSFPVLKGKQILECLHELQIPVSEEVSRAAFVKF
jgi:hypothetical protein